MRKLLDAIEIFFSRLVPGPLKKHYFLAFRYFTFVVGGFLGWVIMIGTEQFLLRFGVQKIIGYGLGVVLAILFTFCYHRYVTFGVTSNWKERLMVFAPIVIILSLVNLALFAFFKPPANLTPIALFGFKFVIDLKDIVLSFVITIVLSLVNFAANKLFVFKK